MTGLGLALAGSLSWAALDATRKALVGRMEPTTAAGWLALLPAPLFWAWWGLDGALGGAPFAPDPGYWRLGAAILAMQTVANALLLRALSASPLSATIPFLSLTPAFTSLVALVALGEHPSLAQWVGIALVTVGALLVNAVRGVDPFTALWREPGSRMVVLVAALWSITGTLDKVALELSSVPFHGAVQASGVGLILLAIVRLRRGPGSLTVPRPARTWLLVSGLLAAGAIGLQLAAIRLVLVGVVEALKRAIGLASSVLVGRIAFEEPLTAARLVAVVVMAIGSALLTLG
ncbi:MAG: EamA family transporter [Sandaracinaceae bacterium]